MDRGEGDANTGKIWSRCRVYIYISLLTEKERLGRGRNKEIAISLTAAPYITSAPLRLLLRSPLFIFPRARSSGPSSLLSIFERFTDNSQYASFHPRSVFQPRSFFFSFSSSLSLVALFLPPPVFLFSFSLLPDPGRMVLLSVDSTRESLFFFFFISFSILLFIYFIVLYYCICKLIFF